MGDILVGTASWTDKTLLASGWYPSQASDAEKRLRYYAENFPLVEVDSSYYFMPSEDNSKRWAERTPKEFTFNIKAFSLLTQHPTKPEALPPELRPEDKKRVYLKDLSQDAVDEVWDRFLSALTPLNDAGKLGVLLFQYPQWFTIARKNKDYVLECAKRAQPYGICVEFRNKTWMEGDNLAETLDFLEGHGIPLVCVDMPQGFVSSLPPVAAATTDLAVVRFHGRNSDGWESGDIHKRFGYLYNEKELKEWVPRIQELAENTKETHVLMNNCYRDYAQQNARQLAELLR
jgi:uncharacterized protein YecE (DUF72 family)